MALSVSYLGQEDFTHSRLAVAKLQTHRYSVAPRALAFCGIVTYPITSHVHLFSSSGAPRYAGLHAKLVLNHSTLPPFLHAAIAGIRSELHGLGHPEPGEQGIYRIAHPWIRSFLGHRFGVSRIGPLAVARLKPW